MNFRINQSMLSGLKITLVLICLTLGGAAIAQVGQRKMEVDQT